MSHVLVLYWSHYGRTAAIAQRLARRLREQHHLVDAVDAAHAPRVPPAPADYDTVILGSRIELGHAARGLVEYIQAHRGELERRTTGVFTVSMAASADAAQGVGHDRNGYTAKLLQDVGLAPTVSASFAGGLPYRQYGWLVRQIMRSIAKNAGHTTDTTRDHVFTDDAAVDRFADQIAMRCRPEPERAAPQPRA